MGRLSWLFLSLSAIAGRACAQLDGATPSSETFLRRGYHSSTVGGGFVWIDGGLFSYYQNGIDIYYSNTLLALDLREDWTNDTVSFISNSKDLPAGSNPSTAPSLLYGNGIWYDDDTGYLYTGFSGLRYTGDGWPMELTVFKTNGEGGGTWATSLNASTNAFRDMIRPMHPAVAAGNGKGYALGGTTPINGTEIMGGGMLSFDFETKLFRNSTVQIHRGYTNLANMVYVPQFGDEGIFVLLGGAFKQGGGSATITFYSNEEIFVMDAKTEVFYSQNTTGFAPSGRMEFCTAVVASSNETVEIFMYGGWGGTLGTQATPYDEIYILTLPAFEWVKVDYTATQSRLAHSCEAVGGSQILVIGGTDGSTDDPTYNGTFSDRDPNEQGLAIFNMTSLNWETKYTADSPAYVQPGLVSEVYDSGAGNHTWDNTNIKSIFSTKNFTRTSSGGPLNNSTGSTGSTSSSQASSESSSSSLSGGAIAGIVIGCVAGVGIVAGLAFCCIRRRRAGEKGAAAGGGAPAEQKQQQHQHPVMEALSDDLMELQGHERLEMDGSAKPPYQYPPLAELPGGELPARHQMK